MSKKKKEVYFNYQIQSKLLELIRGAEKEIFIAVAWLTNGKLIDELVKKSKEDVDIKILVSCSKNNRKKPKNRNSNKDNKNDRKTKQIELITKGKNICFYVYSEQVTKTNNKGEEYKMNNQMHHKFCIIDTEIVVTGSYNWSITANSKKENIIVLQSKKVFNSFKNEFDNLTKETKKEKTELRKGGYKEVSIKKITKKKKYNKKSLWRYGN